MVLLSVTLLRVLGVTPTSDPGEKELLRLWYLTLGLAVVLGFVSITIDLLTKRKKIATLTGIFAGVVIGMLLTGALSFVIELLLKTYQLDSTWGSMLKILVGICFCYLGVTIVLQTQDDFRLVIPYVEFAKQMRGVRPLMLDSSALIDGRIVDVAATGLVQAPIVIPRFVVLELQALADSADKLKRARGRRGLDMVGKLQRNGKLDISIDPKAVPGKGVDQMIVELARQLDAMVVTTDSGLSRVASIQGVPVLNLHDLAVAVKPSLVTGETLELRLVKRGEQPQQGVGYLDDGTMVVVEDGREAIDQEVEVTVVSTLQTSAGRMIFAKLARGMAEYAAKDGARDGVGPPGPTVELTQLAAADNGDSTIADDEITEPEASNSRDAVNQHTATNPEPHAAEPTPREKSGPFPPNAPRRPNRLRNPRR